MAEDEPREQQRGDGEETPPEDREEERPSSEDGKAAAQPASQAEDEGAEGSGKTTAHEEEGTPAGEAEGAGEETASEKEIPEEEAEGETSEGPESAADEGRAPVTEAPEERKPPGAELEPIAIEPQQELSAEERARLEAEAEERARAEAEATAEAGEEPLPAREPTVELPSEARIQATGKRKSSIARVILRAGDGGFEINRRALEEYFPRHQHQALVRQPLLSSGYQGKVDVRVRVHGGGVSGQAGAIRHGIARALTEIDPELRGELKRRGLLTRDARAKERRKAGLKKARKRPQFSKR
jgi:small subunit ribosomal protein S9